jgi:hypothetical protein
MSTMTRSRWLGPAFGMLLALVAERPARAQSIGPYFLGVPYGTAAVGDPLYDETKLDLFYPVHSYPHILGLNTPVMPVAVLVHGGNSNTPLSGPADLSDLQLALLAKGFVVAIPSYHVLDLAGEPYVNATMDVGRVVQFLRHYHEIVNIDPARVFCQGHSAGGFHALYLGLNVDFQDLASPDPVLHESSRPDFLVPWAAPSDWICFDFLGSANPYYSLLIFGTANPANVTAQQKQAQSPTWWLAHPQLYGRTTTPPMCLVYNLSLESACGAITDVHDGEFGVLLSKAINRLCATSGAGQQVCSDSVLITSDSDTVVPDVAAWMVARAF